MPYNAASSGGSNLGPTNPALVDAVKGRVDALRAADPGNARRCRSIWSPRRRSGLDPDISPAAAALSGRSASRSARGLPLDAVQRAGRRAYDGPQFGILGEPRVNVLELNLALDDACTAVHG